MGTAKRILVAVAVASLLTIAATGCRNLDEVIRSAPPALRALTEHLNTKNAVRVSKVACTLKDVREFANAQSSEERSRIASDYLSEKDKVEVAVGLAEKMLQGEDIDAVDEYCDLFG
jgi:hypothetical protein